MTELKETIQPMTSDDYKQRFIAEYWQTEIRYEKLRNFCDKIEAAELMKSKGKNIPMPKYDCPLELLREQQSVVGKLLHILELRAVIEGVDLNQPIESNDIAYEDGLLA